MNRVDRKNKFFLVYDVFLEQAVRKFKKVDMGVSEDSDAFDIDPEAKFVIYSSGSNLYVKSISVPDILMKHLKPKYRKADYKENPAKVIHQREALVQKFQGNIKKLNDTKVVGKEKEKTSHLLLKKVMQGFKNKRII